MAQFHFVLCIEEEKTAAACANQFAGECSVCPGKRVPVVDGAIAHRSGPLFFVLPMLIHQLGELIQIASLQRRLALEPEFLNEIQVVDHSRIVLLALCILVFQD